MSRNPKRVGVLGTMIATLLILAMIAATGYVIRLSLDLVDQEAAPTTNNTSPIVLPTQEAVPTETETEPPETTLPEPEHVVSTATVGAMGDLLMHMPVVDTAKQSDGSYDFESVFRYLTEYSSALDYAAINLETTLYGTQKAYSGYPMFNSPDSIVDGAKDAGFDMLLTANNHSYDTSIGGYLRTLEVVRSAGLETLGTMVSAEDPKYTIQDINGIKVGMLCYTYETSDGSGSYPSLNGNPMYDASYEMINCFVPNAPDRFYNEVEGYLAEMEEAGAEATILYIHWGVEYQTYANDNQKAIAQKLCDLGVDVIIGGHPHVVQPVDLLESTVDPDHKTVCLYSMGNAVSNQRKEWMSSAPNGHSEDGVMFSVTFEKYSDGTVYVQNVDILPTWVNMSSVNGKKEYNILPLDYGRLEQWQTLYNLTDVLYSNAQDSYDRTMGIVGEGLTECQTYYEQAKADREAYYLDLAYHPEKYAAEATETTVIPTETETVATDAA